MKYLFLVLTMIGLAANAEAAVKTQVIEYKQGDTLLEGYLAWDDAEAGKRPGILVVHEWTGLGPYVKKRAEMLARMGYVAFAADIYGKGVRPTQAEAAKVAAIYKDDRNLMRERAKAGLETLKAQKQVDRNRLAAIGYCFGGTTVLELARSGADLKGTVSFHGGLATPNSADAKNITGRVLALHGADDPFVKADEVAAFQDEMRTAGVDWQLNIYGGAVHGFTNPEAGNDNKKGAAYNEKADKRSWEAMKVFFREIFR
ncbi:dienelactone hydrolase family protein [Geobacter sp. SVR]|uniref:dienelactone hydrolase family protein n=1 Tax=Geobacter sp. SVR TaxID=2495594 RepID=UPI00143EF665|nr:dienelactone hydrolase family protein [Geobacter sp. SVR]BCS54619.1 dienelactone hydrolase [Geobacter sp. SVR]GCF86873.1 dienelactone hydrolase [Geobacter sp. SVR]